MEVQNQTENNIFQKKKWDQVETETTLTQQGCEEACAYYFISNDLVPEEEQIERMKSGYWNSEGKVVFMREAHIQYLRNHIQYFGRKYIHQLSS